MGHLKIFQHRAVLSISLLLNQHFPWLLQSLEIETIPPGMPGSPKYGATHLSSDAPASPHLQASWLTTTILSYLCSSISPPLCLPGCPGEESPPDTIPVLDGVSHMHRVPEFPVYLIHGDWRHLSASLQVLGALFNSRWKKARMARDSILPTKANSVPHIFITHSNVLHEIYFKRRKISITFCM